MLRVGLTGGIGSGKSTISAGFAALGVPVIDTDLIAHELTTPGSEAVRRIAEIFGSEVLSARGALVRSRLRQLVFSDDEKRLQLENILHPMIKQQVIDLVQKVREPYCIIVIPLLLEKSWGSLVDRILVVDCPIELQAQRVEQRDGRPAEEVHAIIGAQLPREARVAAADDVILNTGSKTDLDPQIVHLHRKYLALATQTS